MLRVDNLIFRILTYATLSVFVYIYIYIDWLEMSGSLILLLVVSPVFFAYTLRESWPGVVICLLIGCYLLQEHIRASGGFRNSFTQSHGVSNTVGIILLLTYPIWTIVVHFLH